MMQKTKKSDNPIKCIVVEQIPIGKLKTHKHNARKHSAEQVAKIAESISTFGWTNPILADGEGVIIAGHGRLEAAKTLKQKKVPVIRVEHLNEEQKRALMLADNKLGELAEWDEDILELELAELKALDLDFDLGVTGFDLGALDLSTGGEEQNQAEEAPRGNKKPEKKSKAPGKCIPDGKNLRPVSRPGDVIVLGAHRLICGRALYDSDVCLRLMQGEKAQMAFTALPIRARIEGGLELGAAKRLTLEGINGYLRSDEFTERLVEGLSRQIVHCEANAPKFVLVPATMLNEVLEACRYLYPIDEARDYGAELLLISGPELQSIASKGDGNLLVKPTITKGTYLPQLVKEAILEASVKGDLVLDVYGSSGATLMACEETGRCARVIELSGANVDAAIGRWQDLTGLEASLEHTGQSFAEVRQERMAQGSDENPYFDPVLEEQLAEGGA